MATALAIAWHARAALRSATTPVAIRVLLAYGLKVTAYQALRDREKHYRDAVLPLFQALEKDTKCPSTRTTHKIPLVAGVAVLLALYAAPIRFLARRGPALLYLRVRRRRRRLLSRLSPTRRSSWRAGTGPAVHDGPVARVAARQLRGRRRPPRRRGRRGGAERAVGRRRAAGGRGAAPDGEYRPSSATLSPWTGVARLAYRDDAFEAYVAATPRLFFTPTNTATPVPCRPRTPRRRWPPGD